MRSSSIRRIINGDVDLFLSFLSPDAMKQTRSRMIREGTRVQVVADTTLPEFPQLLIGGWEGTVVECLGRGADQQCIVEWDDSAVAAMPSEHRALCEEQGLYYRMACLRVDQLMPLKS
jgi:hypothetical protein